MENDGGLGERGQGLSGLRGPGLHDLETPESEPEVWRRRRIGSSEQTEQKLGLGVLIREVSLALDQGQILGHGQVLRHQGEVHGQVLRPWEGGADV